MQKKNAIITLLIDIRARNNSNYHGKLEDNSSLCNVDLRRILRHKVYLCTRSVTSKKNYG